MNCDAFLGFSPAAIAMFSEILYSQNNTLSQIKIIHNLSIDHNEELDYRLPGIEYQHLNHLDWKRQSNDRLYWGVNKSKTKQAVFDFFNGSHRLELDDLSSEVHKNAQVSKTVSISPGVMINPGVTIAPFTIIYHGVTINRNVSIGHHSVIDQFTTIHPGVNIAGHVKIGEGCTIGMGANIIDGTSIGANSVIGAGSLVTRDIPPNVVAYGSPAKVIKS